MRQAGLMNRTAGYNAVLSFKVKFLVQSHYSWFRVSQVRPLVKISCAVFFQSENLEYFRLSQ